MPDTEPPNRVKLGPHTMELGADGVCVMTLVGVLELQEAQRFAQEMTAFQDRHPKAILVLNMAEVATVKPESRKAIMTGVRERPYPVCFIQASFALRALMGLMLNALRILGSPMPHAFVDTEKEGRAWAKTVQATWDPAASN
jgi:hypothetical protein